MSVNTLLQSAFYFISRYVTFVPHISTGVRELSMQDFFIHTVSYIFCVCTQGVLLIFLKGFFVVCLRSKLENTLAVLSYLGPVFLSSPLHRCACMCSKHLCTI